MAGDLSLSEDKVAKSEELRGIRRLSDQEQTRHRLEILNQCSGACYFSTGVAVSRY
jgi:hypothetical protein